MAKEFTSDINYRLSPEALFPAQLEDCKAAIRWLRAHADEFGIDPKRAGVWGASAGELLAAALGAPGAAVTFHPVEVGGHGRCFGADGGCGLYADPEVERLVKAFFATHLN